MQRKEMTVLMIDLITAKMVLMYPKMIITNSGNSAWIQALYNCVVVLALYLLISKLYKSDKNIIGLADEVGGKGLRIFVGLLVFISLIINYASIIRIFPETIKTVLLQDTQVEIITIVFEAVIAVGAYIGISAIAKISYLFMPIMAAVLIMVLMFSSPYYSIYNIMPVFGEGYKKIFINGFNTISMFTDILLLNILLPHYKNLSEAKKSGRRAVIISSLIIVLILMSYCFVYPYPVSGEFMIPVYQLARIIHISTFFSRFEAVFQFAWSILLLIYSSAYVYSICYVWSITFGLKYYRPLIVPTVLISGAIALIPESLSELTRNEKWETIIVYPIALGLMLIFGFVANKFGGENNEKSK